MSALRTDITRRNNGRTISDPSLSDVHFLRGETHVDTDTGTACEREGTLRHALHGHACLTATEHNTCIMFVLITYTCPLCPNCRKEYYMIFAMAAYHTQRVVPHTTFRRSRNCLDGYGESTKLDWDPSESQGKRTSGSVSLAAGA